MGGRNEGGRTDRSGLALHARWGRAVRFSRGRGRVRRGRCVALRAPGGRLTPPSKSRAGERGVAPGPRQGNWRRKQSEVQAHPLTLEEFDDWAAAGPVATDGNYNARRFAQYQRLCAAQLT